VADARRGGVFCHSGDGIRAVFQRDNLRDGGKRLQGHASGSLHPSLVFGVYWKRANKQGAVLAILLGLLTWIPLEIWNPEGFWPPQFAGLLMSILGMVVGSLMPKVWLAHRHSTP
jgi:Na+/proline symporter